MGLLGDVKGKPIERHTNWNLLVAVFSAVCSAPEEAYSGFHHKKEKV